MRSPLFILIAAFVLSLLVAQQFGSLYPRGRNDAVDLIQAFLVLRPNLGPALAAADRGDPAPLLAWVNGAEPRERQALARILLAVASADEGLKPDDRRQASDATLYRHRRRFTPFVNIPTGDAQLDSLLDNLVAYIAVAGTREPTAGDVDLALSLLPRLEKRMSRQPDHAMWDTIGCVRFVHGEYGKSKAAFAEAVKLAEHAATSGSADEQADTARGLLLYRQRLAAATAADLQAGEKRDPPPPPIRLPLAREVPGVEAPAGPADAAAGTPAVPATPPTDALEKPETGDKAGIPAPAPVKPGATPAAPAATEPP